MRFIATANPTKRGHTNPTPPSMLRLQSGKAQRNQPKSDDPSRPKDSATPSVETHLPRTPSTTPPRHLTTFHETTDNALTYPRFHFQARKIDLKSGLAKTPSYEPIGLTGTCLYPLPILSSTLLIFTIRTPNKAHTAQPAAREYTQSVPTGGKNKSRRKEKNSPSRMLGRS